ncbi:MULTISPECIES: S8 family peptidase [Yersinia]|uniref:S8 family peptidase n=1 Tax=Yersinia TaxID=629 RepID=UPI000EAE0605|nr:S8 family peptidase [Yersinia sp. IP36721]
MKKVVLGNGEKYAFDNVYRGRPIGDEPRPYPYSVSSRRVSKKVSETLKVAEKLPKEATPDDEIVTAVTLHPSFLAKSYYPTSLLKDYSLKSLGSKEVFVKPQSAVNKEQEQRPVSTSVYYLAGKKTSFERLLSDIEKNTISEQSSIDIGKIEDLTLFSSEQKVKKHAESGIHTYEVVLHLKNSDTKKINDFIKYISILNGTISKDKIRYVGDLAFCFVKIDNRKILDLANFSFVRVVRIAPKINLFNSSFQDGDKSLNAHENLKNQITHKNSELKDLGNTSVAVFDGGLFYDKLTSPSLRYFDLTGSSDSDSDIFTHGELVTSAIMYGTIDELSSDNHDVINVDHYKVYCEEDEDDIGLVDVLDRICSVLENKNYKIANISLGPEVPAPDDEPNLWTSTLDKIAGDGSILLVIAAGNTGGILKDSPQDYDLARIQPPADMLNGLSIGAANSNANIWERANYSSVGPGRRPGYVKPDALFFGGDDEPKGEKLRLIGLYDYEEKLKFGTSFAAPLVTRLAARLDNLTLGKLNVATLRALLIHSTESTSDKKGCGWGRITDNIENYVFCDDNTVTVIYQGTLTKSSGVRAAIPCPESLKISKTKIDLAATLCFYTEVDHKHPVSYSRAGIEVTFRPHSEKFKINKDTGKMALEANTRTLFNKENILGNEQNLRKDAHKWETCYKVNDVFQASTINDPALDIKYLTRDEGHALTSKEMASLPILNYSLVITLSTRKNTNLYDEIVSEYDLLQPISINITPEVTV